MTAAAATPAPRRRASGDGGGRWGWVLASCFPGAQARGDAPAGSPANSRSEVQAEEESQRLQEWSLRHIPSWNSAPVRSCFSNAGPAAASRPPRQREAAESRLETYGRAQRYHLHALALAQKTGDTHAQASCHCQLADVYRHLCKVDKTLESYKTALRLLNGRRHWVPSRHQDLPADGSVGGVDADCLPLVAECCGGLGALYQAIGDNREALRWFLDQRTAFRMMGDKKAEAAANGQLGHLHAASGRLLPALKFYDEQRRLVKAHGGDIALAIVYGHMARAYAKLGRPGQARAYEKKAQHLLCQAQSR